MYQPDAIPTDTPQGLRSWLADHLRRIANELSQPQVIAVQFVALHAEPARYQAGMLVYADGTDWDPGSGEGLYLRTSSAWVKQ